jgi:hypothetical protein
MMRRMARFTFPAAVLASLTMMAVVRPAEAQLVNDEAVGRLSIGSAIGPQVASMKDINDNLTVVNGILRRGEVGPVGKVRVALSTGLDVRFRLGRTPPEDPETKVTWKDRITLGFTWGGLNAETGINTGDATVRFFSRTTTYTPYLLYQLPYLEKVDQRAGLYVGGGPVFMRNGYIEWKVRDYTHNNFLVDGDISELTGSGKARASGTGFMLMGGASYQLSHRFSVAVDMGYRRAKMTNVTITQGHTPGAWNIEYFPNPAVGDQVPDPGDWGIIDFFDRDPNAVYDGHKRTDPYDPSDPNNGGCSECRAPWFKGGPINLDYSGPFTQFSFRVHF